MKTDLALRVCVACLAFSGVTTGLLFLMFIINVARRDLFGGYATPAWIERTVLVLFASSIAVLLVPLLLVACAVWAYVLREWRG